MTRQIDERADAGHGLAALAIAGPGIVSTVAGVRTVRRLVIVVDGAGGELGRAHAVVGRQGPEPQPGSHDHDEGGHRAEAPAGDGAGGRR